MTKIFIANRGIVAAKGTKRRQSFFPVCRKVLQDQGMGDIILKKIWAKLKSTGKSGLIGRFSNTPPARTRPKAIFPEPGRSIAS
jgi:hypothetical protein